MKYFLFIKVIIKEFADSTKIFCELYFTIFTFFLNWLCFSTLQASYFLNCIPIDLMILFWISLVHILHIIVTKSTRKKFQTLRTFLFTSSFIMLTTKFHCWTLYCLLLFFFYTFIFLLLLIFAIFFTFSLIFPFLLFGMFLISLALICYWGNFTLSNYLIRLVLDLLTWVFVLLFIWIYWLLIWFYR
jgi:hypothetical protein